MSSYIGTLPLGDPKATGAYAVAIAAQVGTPNNDGHATDSAGNVVVDFVWGGQNPVQPNDERAAAVSQIGGSTGDYAWGATTKVASARLDFAGTSAYSGSNAIANKTVKSANHEIVETAYTAYPAYTPAAGNFKVTDATGNGTTVTYTSQNKLVAGQTVNITGLTAGAYNLSNATVASANALSFTVTNAANAGLITGQWYGKVEATNAVTAYDGSYLAGVAYVNVPSVLGLTTALATDAALDAELVPTTASAATNTPLVVTAISRTFGSATATLTASTAVAAFQNGSKVTVSALTGQDAEFNGDWTVVTTLSTNTFTFVSNGTTAINDTGLTGAVAGKSGTIKTQSISAGAASTAIGAAITITPWA